MDLTDIDNWDTAALDVLVAELNGRFTSVIDADAMLRKVAATPGWKGEGATAAGGSFRSVSTSLNDEAAALGAASELARQTSIAVGELKSALTLLRADASDADMVIHPPPTVDDASQLAPAHSDMTDEERTDRKKTKRHLLVRARALVVQAEDIDNDTATVLRKIVAGEIAYPEFGSPTEAFESGRAGASLTAPTWPNMDKKTPEEIDAWWRALPEAQKQQMIAEYPGLIGNLDGVDAASRDAANRIALAAQTQRVEAELAALDRAYIGARGQYALASRLAEKREELDGLRAIDTALGGDYRVDHNDTGAQAFLLTFSPDGKETKAAVAVGDPDKARHVSVTVPGVNTTAKSIGTMTSEAGALRRETLGILAATGGEGEAVSTVAWLGYDTPDVNDGAPWEALGDGKAKAGADSLADFTRSLGLTSDHAEAEQHLVLNGHSYGSTTASLALQGGAHEYVDDTVFYGSPGVYANTSSQLGLEYGHAYLMNDPDDKWINLAASEGVHGSNPFASDFIQLSTEERTTADNVHRDGVDSHGQYSRAQENQGNPGTRENPLRISGYNLAAVLADRPELADRAE
ncbi:alpha/beta hydrolase family protein [Williamsia muralis]|uniref:alpha/beta hydrolase n=1 Tax=Williamsia marianensis TaxID=85044 RepID=UPI003F17ED35